MYKCKRDGTSYSKQPLGPRCPLSLMATGVRYPAGGPWVLPAEVQEGPGGGRHALVIPAQEVELCQAVSSAFAAEYSGPQSARSRRHYKQNPVNPFHALTPTGFSAPLSLGSSLLVSDAPQTGDRASGAWPQAGSLQARTCRCSEGHGGKHGHVCVPGLATIVGPEKQFPLWSCYPTRRRLWNVPPQVHYRE